MSIAELCDPNRRQSLIDAVDSTSTVWGKDGVTIENSGRSLTIGLPQSFGPSSIRVQVCGPLLDGNGTPLIGKYVAYLLSGPIIPTAGNGSTALTVPAIGLSSSYAICEVWNVGEVSGTATIIGSVDPPRGIGLTGPLMYGRVYSGQAWGSCGTVMVVLVDPGAQVFTCTITGQAITHEVYIGSIKNGNLSGNLTSNAAANFTSGDFGNTSLYCLVVNEAGGAGWTVGNNTTVEGKLIGYTTDGYLTPILGVNIGASSLIPVTLINDGGADGNGTKACSWTYTAKADGNASVYDGNGTVITGMSPSHNRLISKTIPATRGTIWRHGNGTMELYQTDEVPNFGNCTS